MENIAFVIWMIGYPLVVVIDRYVGYLMEKPESSNNVKLAATAASILLYIFVAFRLYES